MNDYSNLIIDNLLNNFEKVMLINPVKDEVYEYKFVDRQIKLIKNISFIETINNVNDFVYPDDSEIYVNLISGLFEEKANINIRLKGEVGFEENLIVCQKLQNNNEELILLFATKTKLSKQNDNTENILDEQLINDISSLILKIYNMMDKTKDSSPTLEYIKFQFDNLINKYRNIREVYEKELASSVNVSKKSLLIIDDDIMTRNLLRKAFENDFNIVIATNGKEAIDILNQNYSDNNKEPLSYEGILLDLEMPILNGFAVLDYLKNNSIIDKIPVIIISGTEEKETRQKVYRYNIADMLEKPFNLEIIKLRINNFIKLYKNSNILNNLLINKDKDIKTLFDNIEIKYFKDNEENINVISTLTEILLKKHIELNVNSDITNPQIEKIKEASKYYDIGKILVSEKDTPENQLKHTMYGSMIIKKLFENRNDKIIGEYATNIALHHHDNLVIEQDIPIYVEFVSLALVYYSLVNTNRIRNHAEIASTLISQENKQFSSQTIETFRKCLGEFSMIFDNKKNSLQQE